MVSYPAITPLNLGETTLMNNNFGTMITELHFDPVAYRLGQQRSAMVERHLTSWCAADTTLAAHVHSQHLNPLQLFHTLHTVIESVPQSSGWHPRLCALAIAPDISLRASAAAATLERCDGARWLGSGLARRVLYRRVCGTSHLRTRLPISHFIHA